MKTRLRTNNEKTSFRLDVIKNGELQKFYFNDETKAKIFQKNITKI
jgi:hypothetical protein